MRQRALTIAPLLEHPAAVRKFGKSDEFLSFDQTFDPTLGTIEPEWSLPMVVFLKRLIKDASGVTAIEYGLICALVVIGSLAAIAGLARLLARAAAPADASA